MTELTQNTPPADYLNQVFGEGGLLQQYNAAYQPRPGQLQMARAVDAALTGHQPLVVEGPCGVGKSIALLVPAIYRVTREAPPGQEREKRVVIVTHSINLQEQVIQKDLPLLRQILPWKFTYKLVKGFNNFLCVDSLKRFEPDSLQKPEDHVQAQRVMSWAQTTESGDKNSLPFVPSERVWRQFSTESGDCLREDCQYLTGCKAVAARDMDAQVLVTNYHMLLADTVVREMTDDNASVLPPYDYLILDEAHTLEAVARDFFGFEENIASVLSALKPAKKAGYNAQLVETALRDFFAAVSRFARSKDYKARLRGPLPVAFGGIDDELLQAVTHLRFTARDVNIDAKKVMEGDAGERNKAAEKKRLVKRSERLERVVDNLQQAIHGINSDTNVYFISERETERSTLTSLCCKRLEIANYLERTLWARTPNVVLTSATLRSSGSFDYLIEELGLAMFQPVTIAIESPFNFETQALVVAPTNLPAPARQTYPAWFSQLPGLVRKVLDLAGGRTLGLFTSYKALNHVADHLRGRVPYQLLVQGEAPRAQLLAAFQKDISSVLLGTESFWTGVDVPGESLSCVFIDKLPFPSPDDPIMDALTAPDGKTDWTLWRKHMLPRAGIMLTQGFGRLIRAVTDRGVVVIADPRFHEHGGYFLRCLPEIQISETLNHVKDFLEEPA